MTDRTAELEAELSTLKEIYKERCDNANLAWAENAKLKEEVERHEATLRLIAIPELQDKYTPQQLAKHTLRMEPLQP